MNLQPLPKPGERYALREYHDVIVTVQGSVVMRQAYHMQDAGVVYRRDGEDHDTARVAAEFLRLFQLVGKG
jgi:hypothetical protein